ncbi:MAG TPA: ABC transporter permease [Chryseolinea sp.]|nr:ABC transporter permease [Chryseolinea sp.]
MLSNQLKIISRTLIHQWRYSLINISSLAFALACSIIIGLHVVDEQRYDCFHRQADNIYRVARTTVNTDGQQESWATTVRAIAYTIRQDVSDVEAATTFARCQEMSMFRRGHPLLERNIIEADSNLFQVFSFEFIHGNPNAALNDDQSIVLTEQTALRYFGRTDVTGEHIDSEKASYTVTAVLKDMPTQSHFHFDMIIPLRTIEIAHNTNWMGNQKYFTYVKLRDQEATPGDQATALFLTQQLAQQKEKYAPNSTDGYFIQRLTDIHLHSHLRNELEPNNDARSLDIMLLVALFVIVSAGVNYTNLASARATTRAKEIGVRKTSGATRRVLISQFLMESVSMTMIAFFFAVLIVGVLIHPFNDIMDKSIEPFDPSMAIWWLAAALFAMAVGLLSGIYPGIFLSSFNPVLVLKGATMNSTSSGGTTRKYLVGLQFAISTSLILVTLMIYRQMHFIRSKDPGFKKEQVLVISNAGGLPNREVLENDIRQLSGVSYVGASTAAVGASTATSGNGHWTTNIRANAFDSFRVIDFCQVNYEYVDALGLELVAGRNFSPEHPADMVNSIILNETAVRDLNLDDPIGRQLIWNEGGPDTVIYATVVGVVKDFHYQSFHEAVRPFAMLVRNTFFVHGDFTSNLFVQFQPANSHDVVPAVGLVWNAHVPGRPFTYAFLDDNFAKLHAAEERFTQLFTWITAIGIFISSVGLFGLISFVSEQRTREIGIRKVLGASITSLMLLINRDVVKVGFVALLISFPIAAYFIGIWLHGFAYHVEITGEVFAWVAAATLALLFTATGYHSLQAATRNPVRSLKAE